MMLARIVSMIGCAALAGTLAAQPEMQFHAAPGPGPRMWFAGGDPAEPQVMPRSFLGVGVTEVNAGRAKALNLKEERGVEISRVQDNSPAEKAGLKVGDVVLEYNGDIAQIMKEDEDIDFVLPKEGSQLNSDTLCIPKGAPRPKNAHAFINYLLDAEAGKKITETILYPTPNAAAKALMPDDYKNNPVIFPPADLLAKCEYASYNETLQPLYEEAFTRIRAA